MKSEPRRVYGISPWRRRILIGCWAIFVVPLLIGGIVSGEGALIGTAFLVSAILLPIFIIAVRAARLIISPEGVEVRQAGAQLKTTWENIIGFRQALRSEGFILNEPMEGRGVNLFADTAGVRIYGSPMFEEDIAALIGQKRFIPIEAFAYWLHHGDMGNTIARYAPHLLETGSTGTSVPGMKALEKPSTARVFLICVVLMLVVIGAFYLVSLDESIQARVGWYLEALIVPVLVLNCTINFISAFKRLRAKHFGTFLLWGSVAVVQIFIVLLVLSDLTGPPTP